MVTLLVILHVLVSFMMIGIILLQSGKGAEIGAAFGGSSQTIFGGRGPGTFLSKLTVIAAVIFMLTSLSLSFLSGKQSATSKMIELQKKELPAESLVTQPPIGVPAESPQSPQTTGAPEYPADQPK